MSTPRGFSSEMGIGFMHLPTAQVQAAIDSWVSARIAAMTNSQNNFLNANGRFWQGLITHTASPAYTQITDGSKTADRLNTTPSDQPGATWTDQMPQLTGTFPCALTVDCYNGPQGHGWVLTVEALQNGVRYRRSENIAGSESYRTEAWHQVSASPGG